MGKGKRIKKERELGIRKPVGYEHIYPKGVPVNRIPYYMRVRDADPDLLISIMPQDDRVRRSGNACKKVLRPFNNRKKIKSRNGKLVRSRKYSVHVAAGNEVFGEASKNGERIRDSYGKVKRKFITTIVVTP